MIDAVPFVWTLVIVGLVIVLAALAYLARVAHRSDPPSPPPEPERVQMYHFDANLRRFRADDDADDLPPAA